MTLTAAADQLWSATHQLREDAQALRLHAVEDRPASEQSKLVEDVGTASVTLAGWVEELAAEAADAAAATRYPADLGRLRQVLDDCGATMERVAAQFLEELAGVGRLDELTVFARRSSPEARAWVEAIKHAIDRTHPSAWAVQAALTTCWREFAERAGLGEPPPTPAGTERRSRDDRR
jgi:hypothetical protein